MAKAVGEIGLPGTVQGSFAGTAAAFQSSNNNMGLLLLVATLTVYIILGILYESFVHPLTILSGLPSAALGALATLMLAFAVIPGNSLPWALPAKTTTS